MYEQGSIDRKTKEMLGIFASMVLRCDDCIKYHLAKSFEEGVTTEQLYEIFVVANIGGGTIVIPHTRRAAEDWEHCSNKKNLRYPLKQTALHNKYNAGLGANNHLHMPSYNFLYLG
jgi:AhpD family alkylhydroperoxidase